MSKRISNFKFRQLHSPSKEYRAGVAMGMMRANLGWQTFLLREQRGLSVEQLSEKSKVPVEIIKRIESFSVSGVTTDHITAIAAALDCAADIRFSSTLDDTSAEQLATVPSCSEEVFDNTTT